jgi:hypothetical protein
MELTETYLEIGITLFMNLKLKESIENFILSTQTKRISQIIYTIKDEKLKIINDILLNSCLKQLDSYGDNFTSIHIAWSFYYFLLGKILKKLFKKNKR